MYDQTTKSCGSFYMFKMSFLNMVIKEENTMKNIIKKKKTIKKIEYYFEAFTFMVLMPISLASPLFLLIWWFVVSF